MKHQFDLNKPSHLIANDVLRQLEILMSGSGLHVTFGTQAHDLIEGLVAQYQDKLLEAHNHSRDNMLAESQQQAKDDDAIEAKLRQMFAAAQYPEVEDVYVSTPYCAYVTFSKLLLSSQVDCSEALFNLQIERTPPLRNRYCVTFIAPDQEEA